jgi:methylase of polypeptide subunit release factors
VPLEEPPLRTWTFGDIDVSYTEHLDGGGMDQAEWFVDFIRRRYPGRVFESALEWCAGPGFIGFALLASGLCERLCLTDINPRAGQSVAHTLGQNPAIASRFVAYTGDNLDGLPADARFDLVVANPPYGYSALPRQWHDALKTVDRRWSLHRRFYAEIREFLTEDAQVCISAFLPLEKEPWAKYEPGPWDIRPRTPAAEFAEMIEDGGLRLRCLEQVVGKPPSIPMTVLPEDRQRWFWILVSEVA